MNLTANTKIPNTKLTYLKDGEPQRSKSGSSSYRTIVCLCDCGNTTTKLKTNVVSGATVDCGTGECDKNYSKYFTADMSAEDVAFKKRVYARWSGVLHRVAHDNNYSHVSICDDWKNFDNFYNWATHNGYSDDLTIERKDTMGDYCPDNCTFVSTAVQNRNTRQNRRWYIYDKETDSTNEFDAMTDAAAFYSVSPETISNWCNGKFVTRKKSSGNRMTFNAPREGCYSELKYGNDDEKDSLKYEVPELFLCWSNASSDDRTNWNDSFDEFVKWAAENGWVDGLYLSLVDHKKSHAPSNSVWKGPATSGDPTVSKEYWFVDGVRFDSQAEAVRILSVNKKTVRRRCKGWERDEKIYPPAKNCWVESK